jgi:hypothetical protein
MAFIQIRVLSKNNKVLWEILTAYLISLLKRTLFPLSEDMNCQRRNDFLSIRLIPECAVKRNYL